MKQKYLIMKNDDTNELVIKEFGELNKDMYSLLCEEIYDSKNIQSAVSAGKSTLVSALRTENMFPIGVYAERIADAVINMYTSKSDPSVELLFNDIDLVAKDQETKLIVDEAKTEPDDIDELLEDDVNGSDFDEKDDIEKISYPLKITDDDSEETDDSG
ncbi:MAG: hypothetical protein JSV38_12230 [Desulfobacterales bacterium]|nr:MAG: hypothetical protein JSV38_12230 [Desulfobacterales bacterium]